MWVFALPVGKGVVMFVSLVTEHQWWALPVCAAFGLVLLHGWVDVWNCALHGGKMSISTQVVDT